MAEEPIREGEWKEGGEGDLSPQEKLKRLMETVRERFARGGFFALAVLFAVGVVFGVSAKSIAARSITIGYWDYQVSPREISAVNMNAVQQKLGAEEARKQEEATKAAQEQESGSTDAASGEETGEPSGAEDLPPLPPTPAPPEGAPSEQ